MSLIDRIRALNRQAAQYLMPQPVVYHHVPKCGGTSVGRALRTRYVLSQGSILTTPTHETARTLHPDADPARQWAETLKLREAMLLYMMHCGVRCIAAHVGFSERAHQAFAGHYAFVTLLRDPVERFLSHYHHSFGRDDHSRIDLPLEAFVETPLARSFGTRYAEYFRGTPSLEALDARDTIEAAKRNLERLSVVGFMDSLDIFTAQMRSVLRIRISIGHENRGRRPAAATQSLSPALRAKIESICAPDIEIYAHAQRRFAP